MYLGSGFIYVLEQGDMDVVDMLIVAKEEEETTIKVAQSCNKQLNFDW